MLGNSDCDCFGWEPPRRARGRRFFVFVEEMAGIEVSTSETVTAKIEAYLRSAIDDARKAGKLPAIETANLGIEKSRLEGSDYSSTLPMRIARAVGAAPRAIAEAIVGSTSDSPMLASLEVAGPGFINFVLADSWLTGQVDDILRHGPNHAVPRLGNGVRAQIEFVSINPTGPLTVGHGRIAAFGDVLARLLKAVGYDLQREYYVNDYGNQVRLLGQSIYSHYAGKLGENAPFPLNGYKGKYVEEWAEEIAAQAGRKYADMTESEAVDALSVEGVARSLAMIRISLDELGINLDNWFSENSLHQAGDVRRAIDVLRESGYVTEREGATWFSHGDASQERENVLVKRTGETTYLASDIAYHVNKFVERKFDKVVNVMGADHHGHTARMYAAMDALDLDRSKLTFVLCQMVHVVVDGVPVKQSKRSGDFELLGQLVDEIGGDATRYFMISRAADSQMEFDVDLAKKKSDENPVHKIRYAHARIASILRRAEEASIDFSDGDASLLDRPEELGLIRAMLDYPEVVSAAAKSLEPHALPHYALGLASAFNSYYHVHRVISPDSELTKARLKLAMAVRMTLAAVLGLMGISAPEEMTRG